MAPDDTSTDKAEKGESDVGLLDSKPVRFTLIYLLPAAVALLAGSAIYVSRLGIDQDVHVLASPEWVAGRRASVRILAYGEMGRLLDRVGATLTLSQGGREPVELAAVRAAAGLPAVDLDVDVPDWEPGPCRLEATVDSPAGREVIGTEVRLVDGLAREPLYLPPPPSDRPRGDTSRHDLGELGVELLPYGHALVPNLTNVLFVRTTDAEGRPVAAEIVLELAGGLTRDPPPERVHTDALGLAALSIHPLSNDLAFDLSLPGPEGPSGAPDAGPADGDAAAPSADGAVPAGDADAGAADGEVPDGDGAERRTVRIVVATAPAQLVLRLASPLPAASEQVAVRVESLHGSRPVYVDGYADGAWVVGRTTLLRDGRAAVRVPRLPPGLVLLQGYTTPMSVGRGFSAHHVYLLEAGEDPADVLRAIATRLRDADVDRPYAEALLEGRLLSGRDVNVDRAAAFLLSRLDRGYHRPQRLVSSEQVRSAELTRFQRDYKLRISIAIGVVGLLATLLIAYSFSVSAWRARQRRLIWEADTGAKEEDLYVTSMGRPKGLDRFRIVVQIALMVGTVAVGFLLMAVLVGVMAWYGQ